MNQFFDDYLSYGAILLGILFWALLAIKAFRHWNQLKKSLLESGAKWPLHSQEELNANARTNLANFYKIAAQDMGHAARILFTMRTDNPAVQKSLRGIRQIFLIFITVLYRFKNKPWLFLHPAHSHRRRREKNLYLEFSSLRIFSFVLSQILKKDGK